MGILHPGFPNGLMEHVVLIVAIQVGFAVVSYAGAWFARRRYLHRMIEPEPDDEI